VGHGPESSSTSPEVALFIAVSSPPQLTGVAAPAPAGTSSGAAAVHARATIPSRILPAPINGPSATRSVLPIALMQLTVSPRRPSRTPERARLILVHPNTGACASEVRMVRRTHGQEGSCRPDSAARRCVDDDPCGGPGGPTPHWFSDGELIVGARARFDHSDHAQAMALSGMAQGGGYLIAAGGPALIGAIYDMTGSWTVPFLVLLFLLLPMGLAGYLAAGNRSVARPQPR